MFVAVFRTGGGSIAGSNLGLKGEICKRLRAVIGMVCSGIVICSIESGTTRC